MKDTQNNAQTNTQTHITCILVLKDASEIRFVTFLKKIFYKIDVFSHQNRKTVCTLVIFHPKELTLEDTCVA